MRWDALLQKQFIAENVNVLTTKTITTTTATILTTNLYRSAIANECQVGKVCIRAKWPIRPALISGFCDIKRLFRVFLLPPGWDASPSRSYPQH